MDSRREPLQAASAHCTVHPATDLALPEATVLADIEVKRLPKNGPLEIMGRAVAKTRTGARSADGVFIDYIARGYCQLKAGRVRLRSCKLTAQLTSDIAFRH